MEREEEGGGGERVTNRGRSFETNEIPSFEASDGWETSGEPVRRKASRRRATLVRMRTTLNERSLTSHAINLEEEKRRFAKCGTRRNAFHLGVSRDESVRILRVTLCLLWPRGFVARSSNAISLSLSRLTEKERRERSESGRFRRIGKRKGDSSLPLPFFLSLSLKIDNPVPTRTRLRAVRRE